ncbi:MAG: phosphodiester glycosidase family protein [Ignavibacteriales bacterium]|nr:phosphodiester glycosidase family protein [Ignavibacteriales bacterium]
MKKFLLFIFSTLFITNLYSQYQLDTVSSKTAGPGVIHTKILVKSAPWTINVLEVDLKNPFIKIESVKSKDKLIGMERASSISSRKNYDGHHVVGAVNADFYNTANGIPINIQVANGELLRTPIALSTIGFDVDKKPMLNIVNFQGKVIAQNSSAFVSEVNTARGENQLILYNSYFGNSTATNLWGTEVLIQPIDEWLMNDTMNCVVENLVKATGNMIIPAGKTVLSGHGSSETFINNNIKIGDTIKVYMGISPGISRLKEMLGGFPKIVADGKDYVDQGYQQEGGPSHTYEKHPRTAAGFSADSSKLFLITVDGRQAISAGMDLHELAKIMIQLGVYQGLNFDGGGSTTMVVRGKIENSPSDPGGERSVANAMLVVSSEPVVPVGIKVTPKRIYVDTSTVVNFETGLKDKYETLSALNNDLCNWTVDSPLIGKVDSHGNFRGLADGVVKVIVEYHGFYDTAEVHIELGKGIRTLDTLDNLSTWILSGANYDSLATNISFSQDYKTLGNGSFKVDYKFTYEGKFNYIYLDPVAPIQIYGTPESFFLDVKADSVKHKMFYVVSDNDGELFRVNANKYLERAFTFDTITCPTTKYIPINNSQTLNFPISIKRIEVQLGSKKVNGQIYSGTLYFDNLRVKYSTPTTNVSAESMVAKGFYLLQNYPNPFNPVTQIRWHSAIRDDTILKVFDVLGREVATLINKETEAGLHQVSWNASNCSSGLYFYRLQSGNFSETKKMILVR